MMLVTLSQERIRWAADLGKVSAEGTGLEAFVRVAGALEAVGFDEDALGTGLAEDNLVASLAEDDLVGLMAAALEAGFGNGMGALEGSLEVETLKGGLEVETLDAVGAADDLNALPEAGVASSVLGRATGERAAGIGVG